MSDSTPAEPGTVQRSGIRRAPKFGVFLGLGAALGALVAIIATYSVPQPTPQQLALDPTLPSTEQVLGYLLVWGLAIGLAVGGIVAVVVDRVLRRRVISVDVQRELVVEPPHYAEPTDPADLAEPETQMNALPASEPLAASATGADSNPKPTDPDPDQPGELPADPDLTPEPPDERVR